MIKVSLSNKFHVLFCSQKSFQLDLPARRYPCLPWSVALPRFSACFREFQCSGDCPLASHEAHRFSGLTKKNNGNVIIVFFVPCSKKLTSIASSKSFWSISPLWLTSENKMKTMLRNFSNWKRKIKNRLKEKKGELCLCFKYKWRPTQQGLKSTFRFELDLSYLASTMEKTLSSKEVLCNNV